MLFSFPEMMKCARKASLELEKIIKKHQVDIVISDNRYELHSPKVYNVFVTHQLNISTRKMQKLFKPVITHLINRHIRQYDELWIPDFENQEQSLAGSLSHPARYPVKNYQYISPLSRFKQQKTVETASFDLLVILSGPEPQRTIFEQIVTGQLTQTNLQTVILQGKPEVNKRQTQGNITFISHTEDEEMASLISSARLVLSRPGYSTIMDLTVFGKKAVFVPTPGQTEQEYLARKLEQSGWCYYEEQKSFDLARAVDKAKIYTGLPEITENGQLETSVKNLLQQSTG
jgi:uncharacterized protein (TIGR00661 family)